MAGKKKNLFAEELQKRTFVGEEWRESLVCDLAV